MGSTASMSFAVSERLKRWASEKLARMALDAVMAWRLPLDLDIMMSFVSIFLREAIAVIFAPRLFWLSTQSSAHSTGVA
jgi:hypothetical protein